jgi:hypothetical protein
MENHITRVTIDLLTKNAEARDNMMLTVQYVHDFEMAVLKIEKKEYYDALFSEKVSSIKTIDRIWRKVQEQNPKLRGVDWDKRQIQAGLMSAELINDSSGQLSFFQ